MKHLKKFESFSVNEEEGSFRKFFTGHADKAEEVGSMKSFLTDLDKFEKLASDNQDIVFNKEELKKKAKENGYKGHLEKRDSRSGGTYIIYVTKNSDFQNIAGSAAAKRDSPLN